MVMFLDKNHREYETVSHKCPCCGDTCDAVVSPDTAAELRLKPAVLCGGIPSELQRRISTGLCDACNSAILFDAFAEEPCVKEQAEYADELVCV